MQNNWSMIYYNNLLVTLDDLDYEDCDETQIKRVTEDGEMPVSQRNIVKFTSIQMNLINHIQLL